MPKKKPPSPADLPQGSDAWVVATRLLRVWITPDDEEPSRPYMTIIIDLDRHLIYASDMTAEYPQPRKVLTMLSKAMRKPEKSTHQQPHRPAEIHFEGDALREALQAKLEKLGIDAISSTRAAELDEFFADLDEHMRGGPEPPRLLSVTGVTATLVGDLFEAAADFYRAAPWVRFTDQHIFAVTVLPDNKPRFVMIMGYAGVEYGLAMYRRWSDVERMYQHADSPFEMLPYDGGNSFFFEEVTGVPFDDLDAIEEHGWEVAGPAAYPVPYVFSRSEEVRRPKKRDLLWYEAALRALPIFSSDHMREAGPDEFEPVEADVEVHAHAGPVTVHIKYPGGTIPEEMRPVRMMDWPDLDAEDDEQSFIPDRRGMEGTLARLAADIGGAETDRAQELMYAAWEETNPAQRIILAHEALSVSADCADAYVLLAEEEADTRARARDYYQKGVAAGERALGKGYFKENEGHFWGLIETRPYMRARQGLANLLWEMGRKDETMAHFRDMLRLNPDDNQGVRYSLLNILVGLNRDDEARELLQEYEDDAMAEWLYSHALLTFRAEGASASAGRALREALKQNPHVPAYLTGRKRIPNRLPDYMGWGDDKEAIHYAHAQLPHWRRTKGALAWLKSHLESAKPARKKAAKSRRKKRGGRKRSS